MNLPGQQPDFDPFGLVTEAYQSFRDVQQTIDGFGAEAQREIRTNLAQAEGTIAATRQILTDQIAAPIVAAQQLTSEMVHELLLQAASAAIEPVSLIAQLEQFSQIAPPAPQSSPTPAVRPGNGRVVIPSPTQQGEGVQLPPSGPTLPGGPEPPPTTPYTPLTGAALCAALQASIPSDFSQVYTAWVWQNPAGPPPATMPGGYAVTTGFTYPPGTIGPPDTFPLITGANPDAIAAALSAATGCVLTVPYVFPPPPPTDEQPEVEPPAPPEPPPTHPEPEPEPEPPAPTPSIPEACGGGDLVLPECYYWIEGCPPGAWALWFHPETCSLVRVQCGCDPNSGCPPPSSPYVYLGNVGIRPPNFCIIEGVVGWHGGVIPPPVVPPVLPPPTETCADALEGGRAAEQGPDQGVCYPPGEPIPPDATPAPPAFVPRGKIDWNSPTVCMEIDALSNLPSTDPVQAYLLAAGLVNENGDNTTPTWAFQIADVLRTLAFPTLDGLFKQVRLALASVFPLANELQYQAYVDSVLSDPNRIAIADAIASFSRGLMKFGTFVGYTAYEAFVTPPMLWVRLNAFRQVLGLISSWLGLDFSGLIRLMDYVSNYLWPTIIPSAPEANLAFLAGEISEELWECWTKANGHFPRPAKRVMESQRAKAAATDAIALDIREILSGPALALVKRQAGWLREEDYQRMKALQMPIPTPSEVIMMMGRDAADQAIVTEFNTDDQFEDKFAGQLRDWARQNGLSEQHMRYLWRSHWKIPSPTQLFEMVHRHRHKPAGAPLYTDLEMVKKALSQDDVLPFWQDRLVSVAYLPINWTRMIEAYTLDTINEAQCKQIIYDQGYNDDDAEILLDLANRKRSYAKASAQHLPTVEQALRRFRQGAISRFQAKRWIVERGFPEVDADRALDGALEQEEADSRARKLEALRQRYRHGEMSTTEAVNQAIAIGLQEADAQRVVNVWVEQLSVRDKNITAYRLCKMFKYGIITLANYYARLQRLGFTEEDANNIIKTCQADLAKQVLKEQQKTARENGRRNRR